MLNSSYNYKVVAIIVTFNPDLRQLQKLLAAIQPQVLYCLVIDNTSDKYNTQKIQEICAKRNIIYKWMRENVGIATAQNYGINWSIQKHASHVLLFDQDSLPSKNLVTKLLEAAQNISNQGIKLSAVGPKITNSDHSFIQIKLFFAKRIKCTTNHLNNLIPTDLLIASGSLIPISAIQNIGLMNESLFIDAVDTEWHLRALSKGFKAFGVCDAYMEHTLGIEKKKIWTGRWRFVSRHPSFRYYYIFRNSILVFKLHYRNIKWIIFDSIRLVRLLIVFGIFLPPRRQNLAMMIKGLFDGINNVSGKLQ